MKKKALISQLKKRAKYNAYSAGHYNRILQADDLTKDERRNCEDNRLYYIARADTINEIVVALEIGIIK